MGFVILALIALGIAACGVSVSKSTDIVRDVVFTPGNDLTISIATIRLTQDQVAQISSLVLGEGTLTINNPSSNFSTKNIRTVNFYAHTNAHPNDGIWFTLYDRTVVKTTSSSVINLIAAGEDFTTQLKTLSTDGDVVIEVTITYAGDGPLQPENGVLNITLVGDISVV